MTIHTAILRRLGREHFPGSRFSEPQAGRTVADDALGRFSSAFQPVVDAAGEAIVGHHGFLRAADARGRELPPDELFASIRDNESVERIDRLARALHMVNYFPALDGHSRLFVAVDARLVGSAPDEHRDCFDALLTSLDVPTSRVVVALPESALDDPVTFVRSTLSYRIRGYRVLATLRPADAHADLDHVFMADPDYVAVDATRFPPSGEDGHGRERVRKIVQALHARGISTLAKRVETEDESAFAREAGFTFLQGRWLAPPVPEVPHAAPRSSRRVPMPF